MFKCKVCDNEINENDKFCQNCGTIINSDNIYKEYENQNVSNKNTKFCQNCGQQIDINAEICPKCGVRLINLTENKNPFVALILSVIYQGLGQFYNGQTKKGIILLIGGILSFFLYIFIIGILLYLVIWIYGIYDAHKTAIDINNGINVIDDFNF